MMGAEAAEVGRAQSPVCQGHGHHFRLYPGLYGRPLKGLKQRSDLMRFIFLEDFPARKKV